ncbi:hypothetical protein RvY_17259 [Ramazzottius varieornatus]|uniref:Uncharacterized protein n=1 Tax=Ramazzottius varieornatus TaxID=947166 RepID=A0A1D1W7I8_RAMVA|nr:hypothetical protein RvY_17259 [Ramazzottius varieornatus]
MPPKRTKNQAEAQSATKKLQTTDDPWTKDWFEARTPTRNCGTSWASTCGKKYSPSWTFVSATGSAGAIKLDFGGITNLVLIGRKITPSHYMKTGKVFAVKKQPLQTVTFWGGRFTHREVVRAAFPLQAKDILMQLMKCELHWDSEGHFMMTFSDVGLHFGEVEDYKLSLKMFFWNVPVSVQHLAFDETFNAAVSNETDQLRWLFKRYDQLNLIWPYGEDQVAWLTASIELWGQTGGNV